MKKPLAGRRIGLLTASASRLGGGVSEAVIAQAAMIRSLGGEAVIFALADRHSDDDCERYLPSRATFCPVVGPAQIGFSPGLVPALIEAELDCLHLHGIWMYPSRAGAIWAQRTGRPYLISPHGMLDPWITARGRWKKAIARWGYERSSWARARAFHALTGREAEDIRRETGRTGGLVIPNAGPAAQSEPDGPREPRVLYIGRIHTKKNLVALVQGWVRLSPGGDARLTIAGWGDEADVAQLNAALLTAPPSVEFIGPVYGSAKQHLLNTARFTILPSHSEGLPMSVLEGWASGTPSIKTDQCNLPDGFATGAAIECGYDTEAISSALGHALSLTDAEWLGMAKAAQQLAAGPFSAEAVSLQWAGAYGAALSGEGS
jgi:glycosyltransferase involved in cell wall biosynthesis